MMIFKHDCLNDKKFETNELIAAILTFNANCD